MNKNLVSYIKIVMELEKTIYTQDQLQKELRKRISALGKPCSFNLPCRWHARFGETTSNSMYVGVVIGAIIGAIAGLISAEGILDAIFNVLFDGFGGCIVGGIIGLIWGVIYYFIKEARFEKEYENEMVSYEVKRKKDSDRVAKEKEQAKKLQQLISDISVKRRETEAVLRKYYDIGIIHEDYHSLHWICLIYDYLEKEICSELKGPNGVYAQLKHDERFKGLGDKIDMLALSMREGHELLRRTVQESNRNVQRLIDKTEHQIRLTERANELMEINNYNQEQSIREMRFLGDLKTYELTKRGM